MTPFDTLVHWIYERESIRIRKERGDAPPWTHDPILKEWRFCNVNRCDDRETRWIFRNIIGLFPKSPVLWFNLVICRFINWSPTLGQMMYFDQWDPALFINEIELLQRRGEKVYTGAYMIPAGPQGKPKHRWLAEDVFTPLWDQRIHPDDIAPNLPCRAWADEFLKIDGIGDFICNQIITDMKYTHHLPKATTPDWSRFILAGPGTQRGLNRMLGRNLNATWRQEQAAWALQELRVNLSKVPSLDWSVPVFEDLNNLANCLCEFDKYCRVQNGEGKPRSRYVPYKESP